MDSLAKTRDCHENHAMLRFLSNDEKSFSCHTELLTKSEVSQKCVNLLSYWAQAKYLKTESQKWFKQTEIFRFLIETSIWQC